MKNLFENRYASKAKNYLIAFASLVTLLISSKTVTAGDTMNVTTPVAEVSFYQANNPSDILFNVNYEVENIEILQFTLTDKEGFVFYDTQINAQKMNKNFLFKDLGRDKVTLVLTFKTSNGVKVQEMVLQK